MVKFFLYLIESGLCLSILLIVYLFFLRKETYFRFNRIYLISIMFFSLAIPFVHVNLNVADSNKFEHPFKEIGKFRTYYEKIIAMADPEYAINQKNINNIDFEGYEFGDDSNSVEKLININSGNSIPESNLESQTANKTNLSVAQILFIFYLVGVFVFFARILILFHWIYRNIANNPVKKLNKLRLVKLNQNLPPFSFLNYVFVSSHIIANNRANQILEHEKIHIKEKHSLDLLIAHFVTIFQWFNPFAWKLQKAIKTNHEYIADGEVVNQGSDILDYEELLLDQFISIPAVQLVNNFNLISIKKRITMLNKTKSGFKAKLKAFVIIPFAVIVFLLFANLTINGPGKVLTNFSISDNQNTLEQLKGLWKNNSEDNYGYLIKFDEKKFSVLEDIVFLKEYDYQIEGSKIIINTPNRKPVSLKFQITNNNIKIWWNDLNSSEFTKTNHKNSLDAYLAEKNLNIKPPTVKNFKNLERPELCLFIALQKDNVMVQDQTGVFADLEKLIQKEKSKFNQLDLNIVTIQLAADKNTPMKKVYDLYQILRKNNLLKIAVVCYPEENSTNLHPPTTAFTHKLPPLEGVELIAKKNLPALSIDYFEIDATDSKNRAALIEPELTRFISESDKYIKSLVFNNATTYEDYISYMDMVWTVIYKFRNQFALEKYNIKYESLGNEFQKEVRTKYPIILTQVNIDEEEHELN